MILNSTCSSTPPPVFTPVGFADGFDRHHDGDLLVLGDFVKIDMQHLAAQRMMLDFLHQRQALGPGIVLDRQVHQQVFGDGMVDEVFHFLGVDFQVLRLGLAAVNDGRDAPGGAQFLGPAAPRQRAGKCVQWYRFHCLKLLRRPAHQL